VAPEVEIDENRLEKALARFLASNDEINKKHRPLHETLAYRKLIDERCTKLLADKDFWAALENTNNKQLSLTSRQRLLSKIKALLRRRSLPPVYFEWVEWRVLHGKEDKHLRPYSDVFLATTIFLNIRDIQNFELTTSQINWVRLYVYDALRIQLKIHPLTRLPKNIKKQIDWELDHFFFNPSRKNKLRASRQKMNNDYAEHRELSFEESMKEEKKRENRIRKQKGRDSERAKILTGKKLGK
jgi:hypothetical protein